MPAPRPSRLSLLTFPQRAEAGAIRVRFLCLPKGNPEEPLDLAAAAVLNGEPGVCRAPDRQPRTPAARRPTRRLWRRWSSITRRWTRRSCSPQLTRKFRVVARVPPVAPPAPAVVPQAVDRQLSRADRQSAAVAVHRRCRRIHLCAARGADQPAGPARRPR